MHPSIRPVALAGRQQPGEVDLAQGSVLFLEDLPAFGLRRLRALRKPLEDNGQPGSKTPPAPPPFLFVAAMRSCPCGYFGEPEHDCSCMSWAAEGPAALEQGAR